MPTPALTAMFVQLFLLVAHVQSTYLGGHAQQSIEDTRPLKDDSASLSTINHAQTHDLDLLKRQTTAPTTLPFNPLSADNIAVYIGHTPGNYNASLPALCADPNINIIILSFIRSFSGPNTLPTFDIAPSCDSRRVANRTAPFACPGYAAQVANCQAGGKKVFVSIGGSVSNTSFGTAQQASEAAVTVWNVFLAGTGTPALRPFGNVSLDGVDVDLEGTQSGQYYDVFASTLRSLYATSSTQYYISAAPLCANNSAILPSGFYQQAHFVFPRFYNARVCNVGSKGFIPSLIAWRNYLADITSSSNNITNISSLYPRLYIGALSFDNGNSGYVPPLDFQRYVQAGANATRDRFGGVMLWDGTNGEAVVQDNRTYIGFTKEALCTPPVSNSTAGGSFLAQLWRLARNVAAG